jgi:chromosome segregation protein
MRIKRLDITGFKSFHDKARIDFPHGISSIVGPNGCGKSNIVDAIRWVMGEQSVKQLRGKDKQDVIFAGTNGKPPLNLAEVSLTLENEDGTGPEELKDLSEVMITRRLYRSGESAYLLNKIPCRLKDITNIFLGSGMGSRSYAVIQQGNIGAITDAGPEERRVFIEEAAGITRYKSRKTEALRKVQSTEQNLLRVNDIVSELSRQMAGLQRQARKAERFKQFQERLKQLDVQVSLHHYDRLGSRLKENETILRDLKDTDIHQTSRLQQIDSAIEKIRLRRSEKDREISEQKSQRFEAQRHLDRMENDLSHLRSEIVRLTEEADALESAGVDLEEKNRQIEAEMAKSRDQADDLQAKISDTAAAVNREARASEDLRGQLSERQTALEATKTAMMTSVAQEARLRNSYQHAASNKESLQRRMKRADEEEATTVGKVTAAQKKEADIQTRIDALALERREIESAVAALSGRIDNVNGQLAQQVQAVQILERENQSNQSRYRALRKMADNLEWYKDGVRQLLQTGHSRGSGKDEGVFPGVAAMAADIIEPEASYETAVEAALGEALQYVVMDSRQQALAAIEHLKSENAGRCGFVALDGVCSTPDAEPRQNGADRLIEHVRIEPGYEPVGRLLLGPTLVAADLEAAMATAAADGTQPVVTMDGDVVLPGGVVIGGSREQLEGILAKKQELKSLEAAARELKEQIDTARNRQHGLENAVKELEVQLQQQVVRRNDLNEQKVGLEKDLIQAATERSQLERHLEIVRLEQEQLMGEEMDVDDEMTHHRQALAALEQEVALQQETVTAATAEIAGLNSRLERFNQKSMDLKLRLTTLKARLENAQQGLGRLQTFHEDGLRRRKQLDEEIQQKRRARDSAQQRIESGERSLKETYRQIEALDERLAENETVFRSIETELQGSTSTISQIQEDRKQNLERIRVVELELSQVRLEQENLAGRFEERYHAPLQRQRQLLEEDQRLDMTIEEMEADLERFRKRLTTFGDVNLGAIKEYEQIKARFDFLCEQRDDLLSAIDDLQKVIRKINRITKQRYLSTFEQINAKIATVFPRLFEGGSAKLVMTDPEHPLDSGVEFMIHPPGKKLTRLSLLSGGEKAMSAIAFIFSIFLIKPASFCLLDEIDAPLDDVNVFRFNTLLEMIGEQSQIIMITHNKQSMEFADTLFGVTMEQKGVSTIVSVDLQKAEAQAA